MTKARDGKSLGSPVWWEGKRLPFETLDPVRFEELCFLLLKLENPDSDVLHYGGPADGGRDIVVRRGDGAPEFYQCKHFGTTVGVREVRGELAKLYRASFSKSPVDRPSTLVFVVSSSFSSKALELLRSHDLWVRAAHAEFEKLLGGPPSPELLRFARKWWIAFELVSGVDLSQRVRRYPELVREFFEVKNVVTGDIADVAAVLRALLFPARPEKQPLPGLSTLAVTQRARISSLADANVGEETAGDALPFIQRNHRTIVTAVAGMGKSLFLQRLKLQLHDDALIVDLAGFDGSWPDGRPQSFDAFVRSHVIGRSSKSDHPILLLDGFDQLRASVTTELTQFLSTAREWILTSRVLFGLPYDLRLSSTDVVQLLPLTDSELHALFEAKSNANDADHLLELLREKKLLELCRVPLYAHVVLTLFKLNRALPATEVGILREICRQLLADGFDDLLALKTQDRVEACLLNLSFLLTRAGTATLAVGEALSGVGNRQKAAIEGASRAGLIVQSSHIRFVHQRFQEYYAALCVRSSIDVNAPPEELMQDLPWWSAGWWEEPLRMIMDEEGERVLWWLAGDRPSVAWKLIKLHKIAPDAGLVMKIRSSVAARAEISDAIGKCHALRVLDETTQSPRFGVGVDSLGIPQFDWCQMRENLSIARYPVTNEQFAAFASASGWQLQGPTNLTEPAAFLSWKDATAFCNWLTGKIGKRVRLPTVDEWNTAAGYPEKEYPWGSWRANACNVRATGIGSRSPVGAFPSGDSIACGASDMSGNVWEWCADAQDDKRAAKGGSWASYAHHAATRFTHWLKSTERYDEVGFRLVIEYTR